MADTVIASGATTRLPTSTGPSDADRVAADGSAATAGTGAEAPVPSARTRGRRPARLLAIRGTLPTTWRLGLGVAGVAVILAVWLLGAAKAGPSLIPTPGAVIESLTEQWAAGTLQNDLIASGRRIAIGYSISVALGIVVGLAIGTFASVEAFFEPQFGFLRYVPATALTPLFMLWLGIDESPKVWLVVAGTAFFNILMVADVARQVPRELLNASYTLGAGRLTVLRRVVLPHSLPGIIDVARINLAAAWGILVVAELLAAQSGLAFQITRAQRFRAVDTMFALLIVFGIIGLVSDLSLRALKNRVAPWARS